MGQPSHSYTLCHWRCIGVHSPRTHMGLGRLQLQYLRIKQEGFAIHKGGIGKTSTSGNRVLLQILKHPSLLCQGPVCSTNSTSHVFCKISHPLILVIHCPLFYPLPLSILTGLGVILGDTQRLLLSLCIRITPGRIPGGIWVPWREPRLATCKAITLPIILFLQCSFH